jgi:DNA-binding response OmpR family regulator
VSEVTAPRRLLLVEDDDDLARIWCRALEAVGWRVRLARDGADARRVLGDGPYEAAIVDVVLPGVPGLEVVRELRARYPDCRVAVVTGLGEPAMERLAGEAGAAAFLVKPVELEALIAACG